MSQEPPAPFGPTGHRARRSGRWGTHSWGRLAERWIPEPLRDSRVDPGKRGAILLLVVAAVAALVAAVGVWRDRPEPRPVQSVSLAQATDTAAAVAGPTRRAVGSSGSALPALAGDARTSTPSPATTSSSGVMVISVTGAVRRPGLVRLSAGSRVADAIDKAGGTTTAADLTGLNLAQKLTDGDSVVISDAAGPQSGSGSPLSGSGSSVSGAQGGASARAPTSGGPAAKLDLNTADVAGLDALPGVGPVTAASIVAWREKNGRFASVQQLQEIQGIGPAKYAALARLVRV